MEDYRTIRGTAIGEYEEKKSRFIAQLSFADSEEKAVAFLEQVRAANRTARHNVYERADLLIRAAGGKLAEPEFTDKVTLRWQMPEHTEGPLLTQLQELTRGTANVTVSEPFYAAF